MISWATKRRAIYLSIIFGTVFILLSFFIFSALYSPPNCFDGVQNQGELGVDCGGPCDLRCDFQITNPSVIWTRFFEVSPGFFSVAAYIRNPNRNSYNPSVPYEFKLYDDGGDVVYERSGLTFIGANETFVIFEPRIDLPPGSVDRVSFDFTGDTPWFLELREKPEIFVSNRRSLRMDTQPRVEATVENRSVFNIQNLEVIAVIYDGEGNAVGVSRTFRELPARGATRAVFTWPRSFDVAEEVCTIPVDIMMVLDRSGSMVFDNFDLQSPEPMTTAIEAASVFIDKILSDSFIGLVSFATEASLDLQLSPSQEEVKQAIEGVKIQAETIDDIWQEETNIFHGLSLAVQELSNNARNDSEKFIVLFTDGVPTHPKDDTNPDYPRDSALEIAENAKQMGVEVYSIGLGEDQIDEQFLLDISSSENHYFSSSDADMLVELYEDIATDLCRNDPAVIEIITRTRAR